MNLFRFLYWIDWIKWKNNKTEARIIINAQQELDKDFGYQAALNFYVPDEQEPYYVECPILIEWKKKGYVFPFSKINNLHKLDYNTFSEGVVKVMTQKNSHIKIRMEWTISTIDYDSEGLYTFNNSFDLQNFPFDKQSQGFKLLIKDLWCLR